MFVLAPVETSSLFVMGHASQEHSQPLAPTKEVLSFRAYTAKRRMARLRRSACLLYESQPLALVARTIESEVERNRLCIRPDKHFPQDLGKSGREEGRKERKERKGRKEGRKEF